MSDVPEKNEKGLIKELGEAKKKLEEINHFKNHLLTLASHQFKSPLAAIKGYVRLLLEGSYGEVPEKAKAILRKVESSADELVRTVENVIDLRKIEEGRIEYKKEKMNLAALAEEACEMFFHVATLKNLDMSISVPPEKPLFVMGDKQHLKHVMQNLIDNAIKYTPKGSVEVSVGEKNGEADSTHSTGSGQASSPQAVFSVKDSGSGIKPGTADALFGEFVRGPLAWPTQATPKTLPRREPLQRGEGPLRSGSSPLRLVEDEASEGGDVPGEIKGSGIGLHVVKLTVEAHGGRVFAESEGEGKGSVFGFSLPLADR